MGGPIAIAARCNDGQAICLEGWTNYTPRMVINGDTLSGNDATVRGILKEVIALPDFAGPQPFRAIGYGMIVVDFVARQIHSLQGYTTFDRRLLLQLLDINATGWRGDTFVNVLSTEAKWLLAHGKVRLTHLNGDPVEEEVLTRDRALELLGEESGPAWLTGVRKRYSIAIDTSPFEIFDYGESGPLTAMKARLREAGFPMTRADGLNAMFQKTSTRKSRTA